MEENSLVKKYNYQHFNVSDYDFKNFKGPKAGERFVDFKATTLEGEIVSLSDYLDKPIVLETGRDGIYLFSSGEHGLWQSVSQTAPLYLKQIEGQVNHQGSTSIASVAVHPTNPDIIYTMQFRQDHRGELRKGDHGEFTLIERKHPGKDLTNFTL